MKKKIAESRTEEYFNLSAHALAAVTAIGGFVVLIIFAVQSSRDWSLFSALFYGISLILLFVISSIYHGLRQGRAKRVFQILDHSAIYLMIAGTYTPVLLIVIGGTTAWIFFGIQWGLAITGILLKVFLTGKYEVISTLIYALMGWMIIVRADLLITNLSDTAFWLLLSGGIVYTAGILFFLLDRYVPFAHFVWHLFVVVGSLLHYIMLAIYVI